MSMRVRLLFPIWRHSSDIWYSIRDKPWQGKRICRIFPSYFSFLQHFHYLLQHFHSTHILLCNWVLHSDLLALHAFPQFYLLSIGVQSLHYKKCKVLYIKLAAKFITKFIIKRNTLVQMSLTFKFVYGQMNECAWQHKQCNSVETW